MKNVLFIFFFFILYFGNTQNLSNCYDQVKSSVVVVNILDVSPITTGSQLTFVTKSYQGSGVLISKDGMIWTASHVVQTAEMVSVEFTDGSIYEAEVVSSHPLADVALIKVMGDFNIKGKSVAKIGDSDSLRIGEDIFIIGAPFGLRQTLSKGILSGRHVPDSLTNKFNRIEFLQTDAVINQGNSGGPMFNMKGEVVGITSSIYSFSGRFNGIGFAVSSNTTKNILIEEPTIWTGMKSVIVTGDFAKALNIPQESALLILDLSSKGTASKIGLRGGTINANIDGVNLVIGGDVILEFAGISIAQANFRDLITKKLDTYNKGATVTVTILRDGKIKIMEFLK